MSERGNHLQENYRRHWIKCGNIIHDLWMWIPDDLGFSRCAMPLYVIVVIFRKNVHRKWNMKKVRVSSTGT